MIRPAHQSDLERLRRIQRHLREPNQPLLDYAVDGPPVALVSSADGTPVGYLVAFHDGEAGYVAEVAVTPECRREGRARRLLVAAFDRLRAEGCSAVALAVHPENDAARRLYESLGFEEVGRESDYYDDGSDAVTMRRDL